MQHNHGVYDTDTHFSINPTTRAIKNESSRKTTLVQFDHNSERFSFEMPRYIEGHDMSLCNKVEVHYLNINPKAEKQHSGLYEVDDLQISETNSDKVVCSWLISQNATQLVGALNFLLRFCCVEDDVITYAWHTGICTGIFVSDGINADQLFATEYVDIIAKWKKAVIAQLTADLDVWKDDTTDDLKQWKAGTESDLNTWKDRTHTDLTGWKQAELAEIRQLFGEYTDYWQKQIEAERARIDAIVALEDGSTTGDAELQDIRIGANGKTYATAGTAVRTQFDDVLNKVGNLPIGRKAERIVHGDIFVDTTAGTITCSPNNGNPYIYANNTYWFVHEFGNLELDYLSIVSAYGDHASWAYVVDTVNNSFGLRRIVENGVKDLLPTDIIIFICLFSPAGLMADPPICYCNNIYFDGVLQMDLTNLIRPWNRITGATTGKIAIDTTEKTVTMNGLFFLENGKWLNLSNVTVNLTDYPIHSGGETVRLVLNAENKLKVCNVEDPYNSGDVFICLIFASGTWGMDAARIFTNTETKQIILVNGSVALESVKNLRNSIDSTNAEVSKIKNITNNRTCKIFKRVCACGDSYTSGHIVKPDGSSVATNEDFSWVRYMSTLTGNEWINCGHSGASVLTWQTWARGLPKAKAAGKVQAYVIGLMINDTASGTDRFVEIGTADDIGTDAQTYYGGMSAIIRKLNEISPKAKIFIQTCPRNNATFAPYNQAVYDIVEAYKDTYPVHCLDLLANIDMYQNDSLKNDEIGGHYTAIGYEQFAEILAIIMSNYINEHIEEFQDVAFIEYDE